MPRASLLPSSIIVMGLAGTPAIFVLASRSSQPPWDWDTSVPGRLAWPLLWILFASSVAASACIPKPMAMRIAVASVTAVAFVGWIVGCSILCALVFGGPFH